MYFTITKAKKIVRYTKDVVREIEVRLLYCTAEIKI